MKFLEKVILKIIEKINIQKEELLKKDKIIEEKETELLKFYDDFQKLQKFSDYQKLKDRENEILSLKEYIKNQDMLIKSATSRKEPRESGKKHRSGEKMYETQDPNLELMKKYNELQEKYNSLLKEKNDSKIDIKQSFRSNLSYADIEEKHKKIHHSTSASKTQDEVPILEKLKIILKVNSYSDILIAVQKVMKILTAVPQMEQFIKEICQIVNFNNETGPDSINSVIPTLKKWREDMGVISEELMFYRKILQDLQKLCGENNFEKMKENLEGAYIVACEMRPFLTVFFR